MYVVFLLFFGELIGGENCEVKGCIFDRDLLWVTRNLVFWLKCG